MHHSNLMEIVRKEEGRLPTQKEFILTLSESGQHQRLEEDSYLLDGRKPKIIGDSSPGGIYQGKHCEIVYQDGTLIRVHEESHWQQLPPERRALVYGEEGQLMVTVYSNKSNRRLVFHASDLISSIVRVAYVGSDIGVQKGNGQTSLKNGVFREDRLFSRVSE